MNSVSSNENKLTLSWIDIQHRSPLFLGCPAGPGPLKPTIAEQIAAWLRLQHSLDGTDITCGLGDASGARIWLADLKDGQIDDNILPAIVDIRKLLIKVNTVVVFMLYG